MTLEIDHSAQAPVFHEHWLANRDDDDQFNSLAYAGTCKRMEGVLMNPRGTTPSIALHFPEGQLDQLKISQLL
eukprot:CAMPEP_0117022004 /NCGR_PEP_ID=MMETSP0472-20121206/16584_1 /TAXON_ID=693140 ORGANISM="Tiarina fusus, Strain LIS" /NCGR_SAMPLE_ID=MMETSP0472 /ASSEMBLY_ACC=CAM_ASM_000603 /LENGTH=72 /DNA_ID=CAMNT_0004727739 /DNA_START=413 /DNA_END=631 /DNA_ORIENTATION=+